jgi:hypothetical protein
MPGFYLMPNGKVASVDLGDGRVSLVSRVKFEECCCPPQCQWVSIFEWDCQEDAWMRVADDWVEKIHPPGTVIEQGDCIRLVYGLGGDCELPEDERPEVPADYEGGPPEEPEACCAPCTCPEGLPDQFQVSGFYAERKVYSASGCGFADLFSWNQARLVSSFTITRSFGCTWSGSGPCETRSYDFINSQWNDWVPVTAGKSVTLFGCLWSVSSGITFVFNGEKRTGQSPAGFYGSKGTCDPAFPNWFTWKTIVEIS